MEKHNSRFIVFTLILCLIVSLFCGVSCNDSVDSGEDEVRMVNFSSEGGGSSSRGIESENTLIYKVEDLYWAYTAVKKSGQYTTGASVRDANVSTSITNLKNRTDIYPSGKDPETGDPVTDTKALEDYNAGKDGINAQGLVLKPVKAGVAPGLRGTVGPFSVGNWLFTVYGYESYNEAEGRFENLIYTGYVNGKDAPEAQKISVIDVRTGSQAEKEIIFNLNNDAGTTGVFAVGDLVLTVPEDKTFFNGSEVVVKVFDVTGTMPVLVAKSVTSIDKNTPVADDDTVTAINNIIAYKNAINSSSLADYSIDPVTGVASPNGFDGNFETGMTIKLNRFELNTKYAGVSTGTANTEWGKFEDEEMPTDGAVSGTTSSGYTVVYHGAKEDTKSGWAILTAGDRTFKVVAEYKDAYSIGTNEWDITSTPVHRYRYSDTDNKAYLRDGYEQVGGMDSYFLKITAGVKTTVYGDVNDLNWTTGDVEHVKFGNAVASITWTLPAGSTPATEIEYFSSLKDACVAYDSGKTRKGVAVDDATDRGDIVLLMDIENDSVPSGTTYANDNGGYPVRVKGHFLHNVDIDSAATLVLKLTDSDDTRNYTFKGGKIVNFNTNNNTKKVWITTSGTCDVTVDAVTDTVQHSGAVNNLTITQIAGTATDKTVGYFLGTEYSTPVAKVEIAKGHLYIGGGAHVTELDVNETDAGDVVLTGHISGIVETYKYDTAALKSSGVIQPQETALDTDVKAFVQITLDANESSDSTKKYIYGIEGMPLTLPKFSTLSVAAPTGQVFMHWNCNIDSDSELEDDIAFADEDRFVAGVEKKKDGSAVVDTLYAIWATPLGGRIFYIGGWTPDDPDTADDNEAAPAPVALAYANYRFYGCAKGTENEITEWKDTTDPAAQIKALSSAVYYAKTTDTSYAETCTTNLFVAYTKANPTTGVTPIVALGNETTAAAWDTAGATSTGIATTEGIGFGKANTAAATGLTGIWTQLSALNTAETYGYNDWFVGTVTENMELAKVAPELFERNNIWSSVQGATTVTSGSPATTYYRNAFCWNAASKGWAEVAKTETAMFIPIRMVTLYEVTTP